MNNAMYRFADIEGMPRLPKLPIPDYQALNAAFRRALMDPANHVLRYNEENGHPNFGAYIESRSNEMVTWGILAVGEWLMNRDTAWIAPTYHDFFVEKINLFMNTPGGTSSEYWYLFYVNTLAGAVMRTLYKGDDLTKEYMGRSAEAMEALAKKVDYDFNDQGFRFAEDKPFTNRDIYRQPDSIAGYAYNMLFAALHAGRAHLIEESHAAIGRYEAFESNPWYEIPNGSAGLMASAWLQAHGHHANVEKAAAWVFDHEGGPLQTGQWSGEAVDGLMMGWRGDTREAAMSSAYSMETFMPIQFLLPAVRYSPALAQSVAKWTLHAMSSFQLFYAHGTRPLHESKPELDPSIPYERLVKERDGHSPVACGDFLGHRSVYGAGYLFWVEALARPTENQWIYALDLSLTDWLATETYPVFLLYNPTEEDAQVSFTPADIWQKERPELYDREGSLKAEVYALPSGTSQGTAEGKVSLSVAAGAVEMVALLPHGTVLQQKDFMLCYNNAELVRAE